MLFDTDFRYAIAAHPNSSTASYAGGTAKGIFSNSRDQYFSENGTLAYIQHISFAYLTKDLPPINKKTNPKITVNGVLYKILNMTVESSLITSLDLEQ